MESPVPAAPPTTREERRDLREELMVRFKDTLCEVYENRGTWPLKTPWGLRRSSVHVSLAQPLAEARLAVARGHVRDVREEERRSFVLLAVQLQAALLGFDEQQL